MSAASQIYFASVAAAQQQFELDKAAAKVKRDAVVDALYQSTAVGSVYYENVSIKAMPGFPLGATTDDDGITYPNFAAALAAANQQLQTDLLAAETRRQSMVGGAADLLRSLGELP
jgi:hypothetical protein